MDVCWSWKSVSNWIILFILIYTFPHIFMCGMRPVLHYNDIAIGNSGDEHIWAACASHQSGKKNIRVCIFVVVCVFVHVVVDYYKLSSPYVWIVAVGKHAKHVLLSRISNFIFLYTSIL